MCSEREFDNVHHSRPTGTLIFMTGWKKRLVSGMLSLHHNLNKKECQMRPAGHQFTTLKQICDLIPRNLVPRLATEYGVDKRSRTFTPWSHVISMVFAQLAH